jgi:Tfp pilus assembly protein PilO
MIKFLDKLNLRPQEKRLVVLSLAALFVVLNLWLVWPHFGDARRIRRDLEQAEQTLKIYGDELARTNGYQLRLQALKSTGADVLPEDRANTLMSTIQNYILQNGVSSGGLSLVPRTTRGRTNEFFEEQALTLRLNPTGPEELVNFLVAVAGSELVIRVKELDLRRDPSETKLIGQMRLVASFEKKTPAKSATPPRPVATARKP